MEHSSELNILGHQKLLALCSSHDLLIALVEQSPWTRLRHLLIMSPLFCLIWCRRGLETMYGLGRVFSHLVLLAIHTSLLNLAGTRRDLGKLIRWTRISLLPITLCVVFSDWFSLKHQTQLPPFARFTLGSMLASLAIKSILFTFSQPSSLTSIKANDAPTAPVSTSGLTSGTSPVSDSSSDRSKQQMSSSEINHNIYSDVVFLSRTFGRLLVHQICAIIALVCWKSANDETLTGPLEPMIKKYKPEITAFCCGNIIWTNLDLFGCLFRLVLFTIKMVNRLLLKFLPALSKHQPLLKKIDQIHLEETCPFLFSKPPLEATSVTEFWGKYWHQKIRDLVLEAGAVPFTSFLIWCFGTGKLHPKALQLAGVLAAFTISGLVHECGVWTAGPIDPKFTTTIFFLSQGAGVCLENVFKVIFSRKVNGFLGKMWTLSWLIYFGTPMMTIWLKSLSFDQNSLFQGVEELGVSRMIWMPLIVTRLLRLAF